MHSENTSKPSNVGRYAVPLLAMCIIALAGVLLPAGDNAAQAAGPLQLHSDLAPNVHELEPTVPLYWHIDVDASAVSSSGNLSIDVAASGDVDLGLNVAIRGCDIPWTDQHCSAGERMLQPLAPAQLDGDWRVIFESPAPASTYIQVALSADPTISAHGEERAEMTVRATAGQWSSHVSLDGTQSLATSGGHSNLLGMILAPMAIMSGLLIALLVRKRSARDAPGVAQ